MASVALLSFICAAGVSEALILGPRRGLNSRAVSSIAWMYSPGVSVALTIPLIVILGSESEASSRFIALAATMPVLGVIGALSNYSLVHRGEFRLSAVVRVTPTVVQLLVLIGLWILGVASLEAVLLSASIRLVCAVVLAVGFVRPWRGFTLLGARKSMRATLTIAWHLGATQVVRAVSARSDLLVVAVVLGSAAAGLYSVAASVTIAGHALIASLAPIILSRGGTAGKMTTSAASLLGLLMGALIVVLGPVLLPWIYGSEYASARSLLYPLSLTMVLGILFELALRTLQQAGYERTLMAVSAMVAALQVLLVTTMSVWIGLKGAPLGGAAAFLAGLLVLERVSRRKGNGSILANVSPWAGRRLIWRLMQPQFGAKGPSNSRTHDLDTR